MSADKLAEALREIMAHDDFGMDAKVVARARQALAQHEREQTLISLTAEQSRLGMYDEAEKQEPEKAALKWPKARDVARLEDMSPSGHLRITLDTDNDVCVEVYDGKETFVSIEFCNGGGGGGNSPHLRAALIGAMSAIEQDNAERPHRAHPRFSAIDAAKEAKP